MNLSEARKILGIGPDEDPRPHLQGIQEAREHIAAMVRTAPNQTLADRYQKGLIEFDQALASVREHLGVDSPPAATIATVPPEPASPAAVPVSTPTPASDPAPVSVSPPTTEKPVAEAPRPVTATPSPSPEPIPPKKI